MTKTIITPTNQSISLEVPEEYVGKEIEILMYAVEEPQQPKKNKVTMAEFKGILTTEEADELQKHIKQSREEWERDF